MSQQINPIQAQAMLESLQQQLMQACANIAAQAGTLALQVAKIKELEAKLAEQTTKGEA